MNDSSIIDKIDNAIIKSSNTSIIKEILNNETDLVSDLMFDSISIISLVVELEKDFNFEFEDEFLLLEYLRNYSWITEYVKKKVNICEAENIVAKNSL